MSNLRMCAAPVPSPHETSTVNIRCSQCNRRVYDNEVEDCKHCKTANYCIKCVCRCSPSERSIRELPSLCKSHSRVLSFILRFNTTAKTRPLTRREKHELKLLTSLAARLKRLIQMHTDQVIAA